MAELNNDPRTQGVSGIKGLKGLTRDEIREELFKSVPTLKDEWGDSSKRFGKTSFENIVENYGYRGILEYNRAAQDNSFDSEYIAPEDFGHSTYDKEASTLADVEDLEDLRGRNQSGLLQLTNGAIKFGGTAASSFVDGTVGVIWGLGAAVAEGELSAFYNNAYAEASKDFRDGMEKWFPNYRETEEIENYEKGEWYKNILTANFFGDHVMKTAGYTVGAVAAGSAAVKALSLAGRFVNPTVARVTATTLSSSSESALMANEAFNDNLKEGSKLLNTAASQELNDLTEGYLSTRSSLEAELKDLDDMDKADELAAALGEDKDVGAFKKVRDERRGEILKALKELEKDYTERANNLKEQQAITEAEVYSRAKDAGDKVFLANMALLGVSEYFSVGRLYERLAKGKISSDAKSLIDIVQHRATVDKEIAKRAIKQAAYEPIQEGLIEEGGQSMIDETVKAAYLTDDVEAYRDALRNKESLKKGLDVIDAFGKGFSESYGNPAVWEEIALGGLMGMTGTVSVGKSNNFTNDTWLGKDKFIGMKGGAIGEIMAARRGVKEAETIAADVNKQLQNYVDPDGTIKRDIGVQAHFRDATEGWDRDTHKFGTLNKQANADFALVQTLYDIGQAKYLETLIDGVDIDQMTDKQLEETAKLLKITDSTGNNLKSDTKEGREEIKELLKRDRDDVKQAIKNFNTAYNVTEHLTRGISIDDDTKRELAYLNFKVLNFQDRSEAIREKYSKELLDLNSKLLDRYSNRVEEAQKDVVENKDLKNKKINNELALNSIISNMKNVQGNIRRLLQQQSKGVKKRQRKKNAKKNATELEAYEKAKSILLEREKEIKSTIEEIESKGIKDLKTLEDTLNKLISLYSEVTRNYNYIYNLEGADSKKSKILTPEAISEVIDKFEDYIESIYTEGGLYEEGNKKSAKEFTKAVIDLSALNVAGNQFKERIQDFLEEDKRTKLEEKRREKEEKQRIKDFLKEMDKKDVSEITEDEIKELEKINNRKSKSILKKIESYNKKKAKQQAVQNKIDEDIKNSAQKEEGTTENTEGEEVEDAAHANMINYIEEFLKKDFSEKSIDDILIEASLASTFSAYTNYGGSRERIADKLKSLTPLLYNKFKKIKENGDVIKMLSTYSFIINEEAIGQLQEYAPDLSIEEDYRNAQKDVLIQLESYFKDYIKDLKKVEEEVEEEIENLPDNSESEEGEDSDASDDATPPVEPNEELTDSSEDNPSTDENTEGEGISDNPDTNLPPSNEDSESENTPPVNVNHVGPNQFPGWKPDVTEFWTHADEKGEYLPSDKAIEGKIKRTNKEGKEYNLDYTKRQKIIFKTIYEFLKKKEAFEVVDKAIDSGEKLRFTVHYELVEEINKELKNNNEGELETYPIVIENADGMVLNVCGLDYTINNEGGINVTQTDIDAIKKEITEEAKKYKEENPEEEYYISNFESEIASMMYGIYVPVNPKLSSLSKEEIKDLKVGVLQKINEDGSYTLLVGDSSITVSPSSNYINTLGTPFVVKEIKPGKYKAVQLFLNDDTKTKIAEIANEMFKNGADLEAIKTFLGDIFDPIIYEVSTSSKSIIIKDATFSLKTQALSAVIPKELLVTSSLKELEGRNIGNILASFGEVNDINFSSKNTWFTFNIPYKKQNTKASTTTPEKVAGVNNTVASLFAEVKDISTSNEEVKDTFTNTEEENNSVSDTDNTEVTNNNDDANTFINEYSLGWLEEKNPDLFNNVNFKTVREVIGVFYFPEDMEENDWVNLLNNNKTNSEKYRTKEKEEYEKINIEKELAWFRKKFPNLSEDRIIKHVDNLIKIKGNRVAYGMYKRGVITLSKLAATGTLYHESFHFVFDLFISNKEKEDIYKEAREKFNLKTQSDIEVEEQLAEAFRRYVQLEETPILGSLIHIFRELKHFIQNFIGNEPYINKLFYKINNAKIDTSNPQESSSQEMFSQYTQEMLDIKAKAIADGTFMKAPNGKPSNLNERQWLHVRTKAFKRWFGDWEKIAVRNIENASTVYNELNIDTLIGRQTINNSDSKFEGGLNLNNLPDFVSEVDSHGIAKGNELQRLLDILNNGIDKTKTLYTAPLAATEETKKAAAALGTAGGTSYRDGLFIIAADFGKTLNKDGIGVVFINDMSFEDTDSVAYKTAVKLKNYLQEHYPNIDFRLYSEAKQYYEGNEYVNRQYAANSVSKVVDENGEPLVVYHATKAKFNIFDSSYAGTGSGNKENTESSFYFGKHKSTVLDVFHTKSMEERNSYNVMEVFLNLRNPNIIPLDDFNKTWFDKNEYSKVHTGDGIIAVPKETPEQIYERKVKEYNKRKDEGKLSMWDRLPESLEEFMEEQLDHIYVAYSPNQIKSATDNIGTYSEDNDDIRYREVEESENERDFWIGLVEKAGFNVTRLSNKEIQIESNKAINLFGTGDRGIGFYDEENNFTFPSKKEYKQVKSLIEDSKDSTIVSTESYTYLMVNNKPMVVFENGSIEESLFVPLIDKYYVKSLRELEVLKIHKKLATSTKYAKGKTARKDGLLPISEYKKNIRNATLNGFFENKSVDDILEEIDEDIKSITNISKDQTEEQYRHFYKAQITEAIKILSKYFSGDINNFLNGVYVEQKQMVKVLLNFDKYPNNIKEKIKNYLFKILKPLENPSANSFNDLSMFSAFGAIVGYDNFTGDYTHVERMIGGNISLDVLLNKYITDETSFREILKNPVFYTITSDTMSINEMRDRYTEHGISKGFLSESKLVTLSYPEITGLSFKVLHKHLGLEAIQDTVLNNIKAIRVTDADYFLDLKEAKNNKKLYLSLLLGTPIIRYNSTEYLLDKFANVYNIPTEQFSGDLLIDSLYIMQEISTREDLKNTEGVETYIYIINKVIQQAVLQRTRFGKILNEDDLKDLWLDLNYDAAFDEPTTTKDISYTNPDEKFVDISNQELVGFIKGLNNYISNFDPLMFAENPVWDTIKEVAKELPRIYDIVIDHIDNPSISVKFINIKEKASYNGEFYSEIPSNEDVEKQINDFLNNIPERYKKSFDVSLLLNKVQRKEVLQDLYKRGVFSEYIENKGIDMLAVRKIHPANLEWMMKYDDWDMVYPSIGLINPEGLYTFANSDITLLFSNSILDHKDVAIYPGDAYTPSFYDNRKIEARYINREITAEDALNVLTLYPDAAPDRNHLIQSKVSKEDIKVLWNSKNKKIFRSIWDYQSYGELKIKNLLNVKDTVKAIVAPIQNKSKLENSDFFKNTGIKFYFYEGEQGTIEEKEAFRRAYEENKADVKFFKKNGVILGFNKDGNIFINTDFASPTTSVHEYAHTWVDALRMRNPELYKRGMEICKEFTDLWEELAEDSHYGKRWSDLTVADYDHEMMSEIVSRLTSEVADSIFKTVNKGTLLQRLKSWIEEFTSFIKETFTNWSILEASEITPEQFFKMPIVDLHKGINPNTIGSTESKEEQLFTDNTKKSITQDVRNREGEKNLDINKRAVTEEESIKERIKIYEYRHSKLEYDNLSPTDLEYLKSIGMPKKAFNLLPVAVRENLLLCK